MIKILHLGTSLRGGGAQSVFRDTVLSLKDSKNIINYVAARKDSNNVNRINLDLEFKVYNNKILSLLSSIYSFSNMFNLFFFLKKNKPNIIHFHGYGLLSPSILHAIYLYKKIFKSNLRVIQTVHTYELLCSHFAGFDYKIDKRCIDCSTNKYMTKIFYRNCSRGNIIHSFGKGITSLIASFFLNRGTVDEFLFPSEFLLNKVKESGKLKEFELKLLRNPINENFLDETINIFNNSLKDKKLVYFGRLSDEKNIECIIEAIYILKNVFKKEFFLKIIGEGENEKKLKKIVIDKRLSDNIMFIPFLTPVELKKELNEASFSIMSSKCFETASLVVVESILSDLVPIVPNHGAYTEIIKLLNIGVFFNSEDASDLAQKILNSADSYDIFKDKLETSKLKAASFFNKKTYINEIYKIYFNN